MKAKKVLIYIPYLSQESGGVKQYSLSLLNLLATFPVKFEFLVYHNSNDSEVRTFLSNNAQFKLIKSKDYKWNMLYLSSRTFRDIANRILSALFKNCQLCCNSDLEIKTIVRKYGVEIIHCPYQYIPRVNNAKLITTLHDVQELHFPQFFTPDQRAYRAVNYFDFSKRANAILVSYQHVKLDLIKYFNVPEDKIYLALLKMDNLWFNKFSTIDQILLDRFKIPKNFLLYPANTWEHKNHINSFKAIHYLMVRSGLKVNVVLCGYQTEHSIELLEVIKSLEINNQIFNLGVVDEITLYSLYQKCIGVVIPTLYEAGSFPLMESILMNVPVICSNVTSLPETIDNDEFTFNPNNIESIADKVQCLYTNEAFRTRSIENSLRVKEKLINTSAGYEILKCYESLI